MAIVREPAVAGTFYESDPAALRAEVDSMLAQAAREYRQESSELALPYPEALPGKDAGFVSYNGRTQAGTVDPLPSSMVLIAPHAGHRFSGQAAARGYTRLDPTRIRKIILAGPTHYVGIRGIALAGADEFATPLGNVRVDAELTDIAMSHSSVVVAPAVHAREHSLEVHLPFLQRRFPDASVLPLAVGDTRPDEVAALFEDLTWADDSALIVSSDLSHFETGDSAREHDRRTLRRILALDSTLTSRDACGVRPVNGLLEFARLRGFTGEVVDYYHSGDTEWGDDDRVVGYASVTFDRNPSSV